MRNKQVKRNYNKRRRAKRKNEQVSAPGTALRPVPSEGVAPRGRLAGQRERDSILYVYIYIYTYIYMYRERYSIFYIYIYRERERYR